VEVVVPDVARALRGGGTAVLVAPPGAGKTTVVPLRLLDAPWLGQQRIVVLEPRRLAARAAATRMAELLGEPLGRTVGFRTRDERVGGADVRIEVVTEGILVRRLQSDPSLDGTGLVVLDEVHERNLVTDLSLAMVADARSGLRPDLRVLAMSATVDAERFARVLAVDSAPAPVIRSDGRTFPVAIHHRPPGARDRADAHVARVVGAAIAEHLEGDVLVFLPGAAEIRRVADRLGAPGALPASVDVRPLFGALSPADQDAALAPSPAGRRRVVLATDIAESSLTVAGVRIVVDGGLVRVPRFDPASGMTRLQTEPASVASADQRAGRAGRLGLGVAYRAWDVADGARRGRFPVPEISVADLAGFVLELAVWGATADQVPLVEPPPAGALAQAGALLAELGALDDRGRPTSRGRAMAALPVHPRLAAMVLAGEAEGVGWTAAILAALLEERDLVRGRPDERPADLVPRMQAVTGAGGLDVDRGAVRTAKRRAEQLARRAGIAKGDLAAEAVGPLVAAAYPERIGQASGAGYRLRGGGGGQLPGTDPLATSPYLAVALVEPGPRGPRIALAAAITEVEVRGALGDDVAEVAALHWDAERDDLRVRTEQRSGALVLEAKEGPAAPGPAATAALLERVRATGGGVLRWTPGARALQGRLAFLHGLRPDAWPDVSDATLLATLDDWLTPLLPGASGRRDLERVDLAQALRAGLDHHDRVALDRLAPTSFASADGRSIAIDYHDGTPRSSARVQDLYGLTAHPMVGDGAVPVVVELLSPARRPVQVTADLPGFWAGSWREVRKEMAGRYPKHDWPADPASATPSRPRRRT
jgi:ATP-dependent helicase HrpB